MSKLFYHTVTDTQWKIIEQHLPKTKSTGRPSLNPRTVFNAILWVLDSGAKWRYIPKEFGNWNSIYHKFRSWCNEGVFENLLHSLVDSCRKFYLVEMDSTFCKVHQSACSGLKAQAIGASRGGKTTKIHVLLNGKMQLLNVVLTGGQIHDSEPVFELFEGIKFSGKVVLADRAYSCDKVRSYLEQRGAKVCIPDKANFKVKHSFDAELYKQRNLVERFFQRIKNYRHLATRYDKLAFCFLNFVLLASSVIHL